MDRVSRLQALLEKGEAFFISSYANIFYYSGFTSEDAQLLITRDARVLITDSRYTIQAKQQAAGFMVVDSRDGLKQIFSRFGIQVLRFEENYLRVAEWNRLGLLVNAMVPDQQRISAGRAYKDAAEIEKIAEAERLGDAAFAHILNVLAVGKTEREIALELEFFLKNNGAQGLSFETIVASGVRSAMPHGVASEKRLETGDFVTMDFGCVLDGYCSDMTRTVVLGRASGRQREIYGIVLRAQEAALDAIQCGKPCCEIDKAARDVIAEAGYGANFGHSLGHSVGIEIHEQPGFTPGSKSNVENGNVITVEPGIYIEGFGGVRIEDVVALCDGKPRNLTASPKQLIEI